VHQERGAQASDLFPKTKHEVMTEEAIARALEQRVELVLPARVLVVPGDELTGYYCRSNPRRLASAVAEGLADSAYFQPTLSMPLEQGRAPEDVADPLQRLRERAARYRCPDVLLTFANFEHHVSPNPLAILYVGLVTMLFVPGDSIETDAYLDAVLLDVRTGIIVYATSLRLEESDPLVRPTNNAEAERVIERTLLERGGVELAKRIDKAALHAMTFGGKSLPAAADAGRPAAPVAPAAAR